MAAQDAASTATEDAAAAVSDVTNFAETVMNWIITEGPGLAVKIAMFLGIIIIGFWIAGILTRTVKKMLAKGPNIDETLSNFLSSIVGWILKALVLITAAGTIGIEATSFVAILGAATLAIGLALQGTLGNVAAGVMLMLFRPYKLGDYVEVAGNEGVVDDVNIFTTNLATVDNVKVIIANGEAWGSTIKNFSSLGLRRVDVDYGIHYDDDIDKAIKVINDVAANHPNVLSEPHGPWAKVVTLNDSSVDIQSRVWCKPEHYWDVMFDLKKSIKEAFDKNEITIPYPTSIELDG
ncbi:MAG: mechanosensitive ion channel family protein [Litorimonas sp.]